MSAFTPSDFAAPPASLCVLRLSAIGDTCNTLPVVRSLQTAWPQCRISWVIGTTESTLLGDIPDLEFIIFDKRRGWRALRDLRQQMRGRRFDVLLHMHASMRANLVSRTIPAPVRLGYDRARARDFQWLFSNARIAAQPRQHVVDALFGFAAALGVQQRDLRWDIPIPAAASERAEAVLGNQAPVLLISPCSSERARNFRNWSAEKYAACATHAVRRHGAAVVLSGGSSTREREYGQAIRAAADCEIHDLIGQTSLKELLALIARADVVLCPDSGPAHMATAVGTPVVGLYATSNRWRTGPYLSQQFVVDRYEEAALAEFGRPVESLRWGTRVRDPQAMDRIDIESVNTMLDRVLAPEDQATAGV